MTRTLLVPENVINLQFIERWPLCLGWSSIGANVSPPPSRPWGELGKQSYHRCWDNNSLLHVQVHVRVALNLWHSKDIYLKKKSAPLLQPFDDASDAEGCELQEGRELMAHQRALRRKNPNSKIEFHFLQAKWPNPLKYRKLNQISNMQTFFSFFF